MPLPNSFAAQQTISSVWWDQNYSALGSICAIQCSVSGLNALTFTPLANQPNPSYGNYQTYLGVPISTNNSGVTAAIGTSTSLIVYKETTSGPATCTGGELVANSPVYLIYDSALSSGTGGFHLRTSSPAYLLGQNVTFASVAITSSGPRALAVVGGASVASISVGGGAYETRCLSSLISITFSAIGANTTSLASVQLTGARATDNINISFTTVSTGIIYGGYVSLNDTVVVTATNATTGGVTPAAQLYRVTAIGFT